eukprot:g16219.t1
MERCPFLYSTASFSQTYGMGVDDDPGPGTYDVVVSATSAFGPQFKSEMSTAPRVPILEKHEASWSKVFISRAASDAAGRAKETPGPGTYAVQVDAIPETTGVRFGQAVREEPGYKSDGPGPVYDLRSGPKQHPAVAFTAGDRWATGPVDRNFLGPGEYPLESFTARMKKAKSFSEGRDKWEKVIFPGCERNLLGRASLGPGKCHPFQTGQKTAPFCKAGRNGPGGMWDSLKGMTSVPGPGAYQVGGAKHSIFRSKSAFNFGKPPPAPRLHWKRQVYETAAWSRLAMTKNDKSQGRG